MTVETCDIDIKQAWNNKKLSIRLIRINDMYLCLPSVRT